MDKYRQMAELHYNQIKTGFLNNLGVEFLVLLYKYLDADSGSFVIYKVTNDEIIGLVTGTKNTNELFSRFIRKYFFKILWIVFKRFCMNPHIIKGVFETMFYNKKVDSLTKAELISIAVCDDYKGKGVASDLMKEFFERMSGMDVESVKVTVGANNIRANSFYKKWGFRKVARFQLHRGIDSNVYVREM